MVGFNRRFAPHAVKLREALGGRGPVITTQHVNAGRLPRDHWTHDPVEGGGRIVGEVCHFVDLAAYLAGSAPAEVSAGAVGGGSEPREDNLTATIRFEDGSVGVIVYTAFGDPSLQKERVELRGEGGAGVIDDFRTLHLHAGGREKKHGGRRDKGHEAEVAAFLEACRTGEQPWPVEDMAAVMRATFEIRDAVAGPR
jgi:predicted dehydrogenase